MARGQHDDRLEQARLAGSIGAMDEMWPGSEMQLKGTVAPQVSQDKALQQQVRSPERPAARRCPGASLGGGANRHDDVGVRVVADRSENARRERAVELDGELLGGHVLEDI